MEFGLLLHGTAAEVVARKSNLAALAYSEEGVRMLFSGKTKLVFLVVIAGSRSTKSGKLKTKKSNVKMDDTAFTFESYFVDHHSHAETTEATSSSSSDSEFECEEGEAIPKKSFEDFNVVHALGEGAYGKVWQLNRDTVNLSKGLSSTLQDQR